MSLEKRLRTIFLCAALELGVLSGVPMRPEDIRALMNQINRPTLAHVLPTDDQSGDDAADSGNGDVEARTTNGARQAGRTTAPSVLPVVRANRRLRHPVGVT